MIEYPPWLHLALLEEENQVAEIPGNRHNPRIIEYHQTTTLQGEEDEIPWCSSFVNWCVRECGLIIQGTDSARARSWLRWGTSLVIPPVGAITILKRANGDAGPDVINAKGHVGFFLSQTGQKIQLLGGNQSNRVCTKEYLVARVLGYRWPF